MARLFFLSSKFLILNTKARAGLCLRIPFWSISERYVKFLDRRDMVFFADGENL